MLRSPRAWLTDVSCVSRRFCVAIGYREDRPPLAVSWDGRAWTVMPHPLGYTATILSGISCTSSHSCTAVGYTNPNNHPSGRPVAERWNGTRWSMQPVRGFALGNYGGLLAVACASARDCTAVGSAAPIFPYPYGAGLIEHWNGVRWSREQVMGDFRGSDVLYQDVSCPSVRVCTAVGYRTFEDGTEPPRPIVVQGNRQRWTDVADPPALAPHGEYLSAVSCPSGRACIAVGGPQDDEAGGQWGVWNGVSWSWTPSSPVYENYNLLDVSCASRKFCLALTDGDYGTTAAARWNGSSWSPERIPGNPLGPPGYIGPGPSLTFISGLSCTSPTFCVAVGQTQRASHAPVHPLVEIRR